MEITQFPVEFHVTDPDLGPQDVSHPIVEETRLVV